MVARPCLISLAALVLASLLGSPVAVAQNCADDPAFCPPAPVYGVDVSPDGAVGPAHAGWGAGGTLAFTVTNTGNVDTHFSLSCGAIGPLTCTGTSVPWVDLGPGQTGYVAAYYQTTGLGSGTVTLTTTSGVISEGSYNISIDLPVPVISLAPHSSGVLPRGFDVVFSHATPAYFSLGQARGVTVAYNSSTARPTPVLFIDVSNSGQPYPTGYSVQVRRASDNTLLTLLNGIQAVYYTAATSQPLRLAVALDAQANGLGSGFHDVNVTVTSQFSSATRSATVPTRLLVVDATGSPFGKGVDVVGLQRVRTMPGSSSVLVTHGDGSAVFFEDAFRSPAGEASTFSKITNPNPALTIYRRRYVDGSMVEFGNDGRSLRAIGRLGDTTRFIWTDTLLTQIRDAMGKTLTLAYTSGKLVSVTDPAGRVTTYRMDASGRLDRVTDPDNVFTTLSYGTNGLLTAVADRGGHVTSFTYDALWRVDTTYAPSILIYTGSSVRPRAITTAPQRMVWQPSRAGTSSTTAKQAVRPDTLFAITVGPLGATVKAALDRFGSPTQVIGSYGQTSTITRDTLGRALVTIDPNGHITRLSYTGYLVSQSKDSTTGRTINYAYGSNATLTLMYGDVTRQDIVYHNGTRGPVGAVDSVFTANRTVVQATHLPDALGRDTLFKDGGQHTTRMKYDGVWGSVKETTDPRGNVTKVHYDAAGRVDSTWIPASGVFTYEYDALNRRTKVKNPLGQVTRYVYGPKTLDRVVDPKGQVYKFPHNALGLLVARHDLADTLKADSLKYDEAGNLRTVRTRRGDLITMTYDLAERMLSRSGSDFPVDSFKYDPAGRWQVAWNANQRDSSAFDQAGRLTTTRQAMLGGVAYQLTYAYDKRERLTSRSAPTGGNPTRYAYNATDGRLDTLCAAGGCVAFRRNGELLTDRRTYNPGLGGSWYHERAFNADHSTSSDGFSVATLADNFRGAWYYDSLGRISGKDLPGGGLLPPSFADYAYDPLGRLTNRCAFTAGACWNEYGSEGLAYAYDSAGNRTDAAANAVIGPGNRTQLFKGFTLTYDANGNLVSKTAPGGSPAYAYKWDALGRLTEVRNGGVVIATYKYDALGRRVAGTAPDGTAERYVYDGDHVILDVTGTHGVKAEYGYEPGTDRLFIIKNTQGVAWTGVTLTAPKIATVEGIATLSGGNIRKKYWTEVWGAAQADTGVITRFRMAGREYDQVTKLYYMRARYYDPDLGRFVSEDPQGIGDGLNLYAYAGNDPVNSRDPSGLCHEGGGGFGGGEGPPDDGSEDMKLVASGYCDPFHEDSKDSGPGRFRSWAEVQAWIDWAFGMVDATGADAVSWDRGLVRVEPRWHGRIANWDPSKPPSTLPPVIVEVGNPKQFEPGMWDMNEYKGQRHKIRFWKNLPGVNLEARGQPKAAEYWGYFYPLTPISSAQPGLSPIVRLRAKGYVFSDGQAIFSADPDDCGCWP